MKIYMLLSTEIPILVKEAQCMSVLDSTCTRTVMGTQWLNVFLDVLTESDKTLITYSPSNKKFHFGDSVEVKSVKKVKFPAFIGSKKVLIEANIVDNEIPLLLSSASIKRAKLVLDFSRDMAMVFDESIKCAYQLATIVYHLHTCSSQIIT